MSSILPLEPNLNDLAAHQQFQDLSQNLRLLAEESAELGQVALKSDRFGLHSEHPVTKATTIARLHMEAGDVLTLIRILIATGQISLTEVEKAAADKLERLKQWYKFPPQAKAPENELAELKALLKLSPGELARALLSEMLLAYADIDGMYRNAQDAWDPDKILASDESIMDVLRSRIDTCETRGAHTPVPRTTVRLRDGRQAEAIGRDSPQRIAIAALLAYRSPKA